MFLESKAVFSIYHIQPGLLSFLKTLAISRVFVMGKGYIMHYATSRAINAYNSRILRAPMYWRCFQKGPALWVNLAFCKAPGVGLRLSPPHASNPSSPPIGSSSTTLPYFHTSLIALLNVLLYRMASGDINAERVVKLVQVGVNPEGLHKCFVVHWFKLQPSPHLIPLSSHRYCTYTLPISP